MSETTKNEPANKNEPNADIKKTIKGLMIKMQRGAELKKELNAIEAELKKYNMSLDNTGKKTRKAKGTRKKQTPIVEADVIKLLGDKELGYKEVAKGIGGNPQTVKKWLDANKKQISKRNENPKNAKSKVLYKVK